jgi:hypothetical protein
MDIIEAIKELKGLVSMKPASKDDIAAAEQKLGLSFAPDYRSYLEQYGLISARHIEITGLTEAKRLNVMDVTLSARGNSSIPADLYVIEDTGIEGMLVLQNSKGEVFEWQNGKAKKIFDNLVGYLLSK